MSNHKRIDMSSPGLGKTAPAESSSGAADKPKRARAAAMLATFVILLGAVAWFYWDDVFPHKVPQEDIGPATIPEPENQPPQPGQPRTPEQQNNPNLPKNIRPG